MASPFTLSRQQQSRLMSPGSIYRDPGIQDNSDVIEGRRQWAGQSRPWDRRDAAGVPGGVAEAPPDRSIGKDATYVGQRAGRGLAEALGGGPNLTNILLNAGIRDADLFTGGALSGGTYEPYQLSTSIDDAIANAAADRTGARIIPPGEVSDAADWLGSGAQFGVGLVADPTNFIIPGLGKAAKTEDLARVMRRMPLAVQGGT